MKTNITGEHGIQGFTLVEMAIVLVIVGLLLGGLLLPFSAQVDQKKISDTQKTIEAARDALIGFALANGRLPCPATAASSGQESPAGGVCTTAAAGAVYLPALTLGITPVDNQGFALDAFNDRIRYAVTASNSSAFTTANGMRTAGMSSLAPNLRICSAAACAAGTVLTNNAVAVVFSRGNNWATGGTAADEAENLDNDLDFVSHEPTAAPYDDQVTWVSPNILYNRMVSAGMLP